MKLDYFKKINGFIIFLLIGITSGYSFQCDTPISANGIVTDISCASNGSGNVLGTIEVNSIMGGTAPYTVSLLNRDYTLAVTSSTNPIITSLDIISFNDLNYGDYTVRIVDANGCVTEFDYDVRTVGTFAISSSTSGLCLTGVTADISVFEGVGPFEIREYPSGTFFPLNGLPVSSGTPNERNHQFTALLFDTPYAYEVRDIALNCTFIQTINPVPSPSGMGLSLNTLDVTCIGSADGSLEYTISDYQGTELTYEVYRTSDLLTDISNTLLFSNGNPENVSVNGMVNGTINGFGPGDYLLRVKETDSAIADLCNKAVEFRITEPTMLDLVLINQIPANCNTFAQVTVQGQGGTPLYRYAAVIGGDAIPVSGSYVNENILLLDPSVSTNWDVYVLDANECTFGPINLVISTTTDPVVIVPNLVDDPCIFDSNYTFTVTALGEGQLTYQLDNGAQVSGNISNTEHIFTVVETGVYTVTVYDANGCASNQETITVYPELISTAQLIRAPSCFENTGDIEIMATGGMPPYEYSIDNISFVNGNIFVELPPGNYNTYVRDSNACVSQSFISFDPIENLFVDLNTDNLLISCFADATGSINATTTGGLGNNKYTLSGILYDGSSFGDITQDESLFEGLQAGSYTYTVESAPDCFSQKDFIITHPSLMVANVIGLESENCLGSGDGSLSIGISGGTPPYFTSLNNTNFLEGVTTFDNLPSGDQIVYIQDSNGCQTQLLFSIASGVVLEAVLESIFNCTVDANPGTTDITFVLSPDSVTEEIMYTLSNGVDSFTQDTSPVFKDFPPGVYTGSMFHSSGCEFFISNSIIIEEAQDSDNDGVVDLDEDTNCNNDLTDDDVNGNGLPNYLDTDDDGDNIPTENEIIINIGRSINEIIFVDTDGDDIPNHMDDDDDGDGVLTKDEDADGDGDPTNDDINNNNIPDYLEEDVTLGFNDYQRVNFRLHPNPASNFIYLDFIDEDLQNLEIFITNILGEVVYALTPEVVTDSLRVDLPVLESGLYFVSLKTNNKSAAQKIIIK